MALGVGKGWWLGDRGFTFGPSWEGVRSNEDFSDSRARS